MYSFGPLPKVKQSGRVIGAHQKIDRVVRRRFTEMVGRKACFPTAQQILHFEGIRGPDGVKLKSPGRDEPWHFIDPKNPDRRLITHINDHVQNLTLALRKRDETRASFEAAWLAHAVTDGLTPAHQLPFDEIMGELRDEESVSKVRNKVIMPGDGSTKQWIANNWKYWGVKGVITMHTLFEAGVASTIKPLSFDGIYPPREMLERAKNEPFEMIFVEAVHRVAALDMYEQFKKKGWTRKLAMQTRDELMPIIIRTVTLAWYAAYAAAGEPKK